MRTPTPPTVVLLPGPDLTPDLIDKISALLEESYTQGSRRFLIDCSDVMWAGMDFVSLLVTWARRLHPDRGSIRLASASNSMEKLIQVTQADRMVPMYRTSREAFEAFGALSM
jgi:anti-anti-sigma regulatory factor